MVFLKTPLVFLALVTLLLILSVGGGIFFYIQSENAQNEVKELKENPNAATIEETKKLVDKVGRLVELPKGEDPTVATITDVEKLKGQAFFSKAANGDKVLIYTSTKRAILYRPSTNKVIDIAPINLGQSEQKVTVALYNGTTTVGLTKTIETQLEEKFSNVDVTTKENAGKNDYDSTIVVDISGNNPELAKQIGLELSGEVGSLPSGETKPDSADILVILGAN